MTMNAMAVASASPLKVTKSNTRLRQVEATGVCAIVIGRARAIKIAIGSAAHVAIGAVRSVLWAIAHIFADKMTDAPIA